MKIKKTICLLLPLLGLPTLLFIACQPIREFGKSPTYQGGQQFNWQPPAYDASKKTVFVVADNEGTEMFDMMAPFYLFNATQQTNVYIVAQKKSPISVKKGLFILPQFTFSEVDSLHLRPDVIILPFMVTMNVGQQNQTLLDWIKKHHSQDSKMLAVCDGAITAAATGLYDGKPLTAHASDLEDIRATFTKPVWVNQVNVTKSGNLFSTAGVSNAVEGSLTVINELFGQETMQRVLEDIHYPQTSIKNAHQSLTVNGRAKMRILKKVLFKKNRRIGVLLQDGIKEIDLAGVLDTYNRSFPKSIETFITRGTTVRTRYGLTLLATGNSRVTQVDELHILMPESFTKAEAEAFGNAQFVQYAQQPKQYIIDQCLDRISAQYGSSFEHVVKLMLDYN